MKKTKIIITIIAIIINSFNLIAEESSILNQKITTITKDNIKKSKARNIAEVIKEYTNIDIKNKKAYIQSTFIVNGKILDNNKKRIYLFFHDKDKTKLIDIKYNVYTGNIVYNIETEEYKEAEEQLYVNLGKDAYTDTITTIKYKKEETNSNKKKSKIDVLKYKINDENNSLNFKVNTSGEERSFTGKKSTDADVRSFVNSDVDFKINPIKEVGFTGKYFVDVETDIALLNRDDTNRIKKQNLYQGGNFGISLKPIDFVVVEALYFVSSKQDLINETNKIYTTQGSKTSISFNCQVGDIGLYLSLKKDYSKYFSNQETTINNNILFSFSNGVFIPLQLNNITNALIIKNGNGTIEIADTTINVNATNVNITATTAITGETTINGNTTIDGNNTITGITNSMSYATTGGTGISGTFVDSPTNKYITFTNGIITAQG